jgi:hypothetical protein
VYDARGLTQIEYGATGSAKMLSCTFPYFVAVESDAFTTRRTMIKLDAEGERKKYSSLSPYNSYLLRWYTVPPLTTYLFSLSMHDTLFVHISYVVQLALLRGALCSV